MSTPENKNGHRMKGDKRAKTSPPDMRPIIALPPMIWSLAIVASLVWNLFSVDSSFRDLAYSGVSPLILGHGLLWLLGLVGLDAGIRFVTNRVNLQRLAETDLAAHSHKLESLNTALAAKQRELEEFVFMTSHDLKSPLICIQGFADILRREAADTLDDESLRYLDRIIANGDTMASLLTDIHDFFRAGQIEEPFETVDMQGLIEDVFSNYDPITEKRGIALVCTLTLPAVHGSRRRLHEVLTNLIDNAVKYMPDKPGARIEVGYEPSHDNSGGKPGAFFVRDNGRGIPPQFQAKVFDMFQRVGVDDAGVDDGGIEGSGVGLAIVKRIIETHGGTIHLESQPAHGTTFFFTLPLAKVEVHWEAAAME